MKTSELIQKAHKIAAKYFDVLQLEFTTANIYEGQFYRRMEITVFYSHPRKQSNFTAYVSELRPAEYSAAQLLEKLKDQVKEELKEIYPETDPVTDFEIDEPQSPEPCEKI